MSNTLKRFLLPRCYIALAIAPVCYVFGEWGSGFSADLFNHLLSYYLITYALIGLLGFTYLSSKTLGVLGSVLFIATLTHSLLPIYPYLAVSNNQGSTNLKLLTVNSNYANSQYKDILNLIDDEDPDIISIIELSHQQLAEFKPHLTKKYPYEFISPADNPGGIGVFSRIPLDKPRFIDLTKYQFGYISTSIQVNQKPHNLLIIHMAPPICPECFRMRVDTGLSISRHLHTPDNPTVMMGDFNNTIWTKDFLNILKTHQLKVYGLLTGTWPNIPLIPKIAIDHVLIPQTANFVRVERGPDIGSDHFPVIAEIAL